MASPFDVISKAMGGTSAMTKDSNGSKEEDKAEPKGKNVKKKVKKPWPMKKGC